MNTFLPVERQSPPSHHSFDMRPSQITGCSYSAVCHSSLLFTSQRSRWILASLYSCPGESVMQTLLFCSGHLRFPQPGSSSFLKRLCQIEFVLPSSCASLSRWDKKSCCFSSAVWLLANIMCYSLPGKVTVVFLLLVGVSLKILLWFTKRKEKPSKQCWGGIWEMT